MLAATAFMAVLFVLVGIVPAIVFALVAREGDTVLRRTDQLAATSAQVTSLVIDEETGVRGYVITSEERFLEPYDAAVQRLPEQWQIAMAQAKAVGGQAPALLTAAKRTADDWQQNWAQPEVDLVKSGHADTASALVAAERGKALFDQFRQQMAAHDAFVRQTRNAQEGRRDSLLSLLDVVIAVSAFIGVVGLGLLYYIGVLARRFLIQAARSEAVAEAKDEFLALAGHEMKTPLTTIKGHAQMLLRLVQRYAGEQPGQPSAAPDWPRVSSELRTIDRQVGRMARLINELLDASRLDSGPLTLFRTRLDLVALLQRCKARAYDPDARHAIETELPERPVEVFADQERIGQVVAHLLDNALRFSPEARTVWLSLRVEGNSAVVRVRDQGIGIPEEDRVRLFEPFFRASNVSSATISGLGVGLYLCDAIVRAHGGRIALQSTVGEGSTFSFSLPLYQNDRG